MRINPFFSHQLILVDQINQRPITMYSIATPQYVNRMKQQRSNHIHRVKETKRDTKRKHVRFVYIHPLSLTHTHIQCTSLMFSIANIIRFVDNREC